jgi:AcrR family transcriptional regulator
MTSDTYLRIFSTARRLFVEQGYTATSMRQVAEQAGIGKATIYHHFADKQAIIQALYDEIAQAMQTTLRVVSAETKPRKRIRAAAEVGLRFLCESDDILQIVRREIPTMRERFNETSTTFQKEYLKLIVDALRAGVDKGIFCPLDPNETAQVFWCMLQGASAQPCALEQDTGIFLEIFFKGIEIR